METGRDGKDARGGGPRRWREGLAAGIVCLVAGASLAGQLEIHSGDGLALGLSPNGSVTSVRIGATELAGAPAPLLVLRDLSAAGADFEPNLLANPGFEDGLAHWQEVQGAGVEGRRVTGEAHSGSGALELSGGSEDGAGWAAWAADPVSVSPGERLRVAAWWKSPAGFLVEDSGTAPALQMVQWRQFDHHTGLYVQWLDGAGATLGQAELATPLHMNCSDWRLTRRELVAPAGAAALRVIIGAKLLGETVWVDDLSLVPATEPDIAVPVAATPCQGEADCIELAGSGIGGLQVTARLSAASGAIAIDGTVTDVSGAARAFDLRVQVPVAADEGWTWWDDAHVSRPIERTGRYEHAISAVADGWLPISLYPYGGLGTSSAGAGLAMALPPGVPQLGEIAYDAAHGVLGVTFHLGISPLAVQLGGQARFHALVFRADPAWGFRDIIERYRDLFPTAFAPRVRLYGFSGRSQGDFYTPAGVEQALEEDAANIYTAQYTSSDLAIKVTPSGNPRPVLDDLLATVDQMAQSSDESTRAFADAIGSSAVVDTNGEWMLKHVIVPAWAQGWWEGSWIADMDPDIGGGKAQWNLRYRIDASFAACNAAGAHLDGVQIDNFMSTASFDFRPEALAAATQTLGYSPHTYEPAVHNASAVWEYLSWLRRHLDETWGRDRGITINFWGVGHPDFLAPFIDGFGSEGNIKGDGTGTNWNLEILDYRRAIADRRPYLFTNQTPGFSADQAHLFIGPAILYGVPPSDGPNGHQWEPGATDEVDRTAQLIFTFWAAGWEPLTDARSGDPDVLIERFGRAGPPQDPAAPPGIFFTVYNRAAAARQATLTVDLDALGLSGASTLRLVDDETGAAVPYVRNGAALSITLALDAAQARVLHLSIPPRPRRSRGRVRPASAGP
ncbi:MAG: hypothetical protein GXP48_01575 [Acidobacteria bacterium]|nr:hypothetical protein [Acidobacteriota bacterium]